MIQDPLQQSGVPDAIQTHALDELPADQSEAAGVGKTVVGEYARRAGVIGITWPMPHEIDDDPSICACFRLPAMERLRRVPRLIGARSARR